ncbi:D-tagatose 1,6-bisphosphate aldolase 2, subunit [uncultured Pleomorphomonas sp.]|uniref:D-tagatose 1,6-bisphosphate aldolase 2, subunit n=1 Tax=uncultured Pleomorphomonas sp. TaxID=442121 RepID=A0A212LI51_9HYPH|nr:D-tagatose 1,6-bisphosphate aldolase 2, subunit [uncultured Pleomorphomonas sp.]
MTGATQRLSAIAARRAAGEIVGITSVCSAHPLVIEAALVGGKRRNADVLIEATCNQVNQDGGYTGMTPGDFRDFVLGIAGTVGFDPGRLVLGGDHLGPNPWKHLPADAAMDKALAMIESYASAGFTKLHLDTSMGCAGEPVALADETTAARAAALAERAEAAVQGDVRPVYVVGTEVPIPGGALEALDHLEVTGAEAARKTIDVHRRAFADRGIAGAFERALAIVVQPGVEFGNAEVVVYRAERARELSAVLATEKRFVFEAHSTDYQPGEALRALVRDGFAILKVGPALTFALREALYGLSEIARILAPDPARPFLPEVMEAAMRASPGDWRKYYSGSEAELAMFRHCSLSDRIRYYWADPTVRAAVDALMAALGGREIPLPLVSQYLGRLHEGVAAGRARAGGARAGARQYRPRPGGLRFRDRECVRPVLQGGSAARPGRIAPLPRVAERAVFSGCRLSVRSPNRHLT